MGRDAGGAATGGSPASRGFASRPDAAVRARRSGRRSRLASVVGALVVVALVGAACGEGPTASGQSTTVPPGSTTTSSTASPAPGRGPWSLPFVVAAGRHLAALSCPTAAFCVALDDLGTAYVFDNGLWSTGQALAPGATTGAKVMVSCTGPSFCLAAPTGNQVNVWNGTAWGPPAAIPGAQHVQALSCATSHSCVAIDALGATFLYDGSRWSTAAGTGGGPSAVSCATPAFCAATVGGGIALWSGSAWTGQGTVDSTGQLLSVSCPSPAFCVAGDSDGSVVVWNGAAWSAPQTVDPSTSTVTADNVLTGVSCAGSTFCVAVDSGGRAVSFDGRTWSAMAQVGAGAALSSVSCATSTFCLAADTAGNVYAYR
ncbi:MAG TPA: hypothetical protein VMV22_04555 [Acidimicrobiales bacterium]|nr:hypothetical protein [Acidimicrobiales bacterium]